LCTSRRPCAQSGADPGLNSLSWLFTIQGVVGVWA
jgi:hypothetical protein